VGRLILEFLSTPASEGVPGIITLSEGSVLHWIVEINFLHFALLLFIICSVVMIAVSFMTSKGEQKDVSDLVYSRKASAGMWNVVLRRDLALTILLIIAVLALG